MDKVHSEREGSTDRYDPPDQHLSADRADQADPRRRGDQRPAAEEIHGAGQDGRRTPAPPSPEGVAPAPRWLDDAQQRAWRAYMDGHQRLMTALNRQLQRDSDLSIPEYRILVLLSEAPDRCLRMSELADGVLSSRSRLTHQIRRLETDGLVSRSNCVEDGRGVLATLTPEGMRRLRAAAPGHVAAVRDDFIDLLTPAHLDMIAEVFDRVDRTIAAREDRNPVGGPPPRKVESPDGVARQPRRETWQSGRMHSP